MYWYLISNIAIFYLIVTYGLSTWGFYLCRAADAQEELVTEAVAEHMGKRKDEQAKLQLQVDKSATKALEQQPKANSSQPLLAIGNSASSNAQVPRYDDSNDLD